MTPSAITIVAASGSAFAIGTGSTSDTCLEIFVVEGLLGGNLVRAGASALARILTCLPVRAPSPVASP